MTELIIIATGLVVGLMNAVAGGGMLVGFPILIALGIPPLVANASSAIITGPGQLASAWGYRNYLKRVPWKFALLLIPLVVGAAIGTVVLRNTSADDFASVVPLLVLFGVALFAFQPLLHFHLRQHLRGKHRTLTPLFLIGLALLPVSIYGGYFGAGFGFILLAFLGFAHLPDIHMINAMKNVGGVALSATVIVFLFSSGLIDWRIGLLGASGAVIGGYAGARFSQRLSSHWLRIIVITIGLSAVVYLFLQRY
jgi:uncharacterized protein